MGSEFFLRIYQNILSFSRRNILEYPIDDTVKTFLELYAVVKN